MEENIQAGQGIFHHICGFFLLGILTGIDKGNIKVKRGWRFRLRSVKSDFRSTRPCALKLILRFFNQGDI